MASLSYILAAITVEPVMFLYMFTNFLYVPVLQSLIFDKVCVTQFNFSSEVCIELRRNNSDPHYHDVNSLTSHWILMTNVALTIPSAVVVLLFYGALGDKIGRKLPLIIPCVGALAAYFSAMLNAHYMSGSMYYILIGPFINGLCGGFIACLMAVYSYIAHIASPSSKMVRLSLIEASIFIAGTIGIFISGVISERIGYEYTFLVVIICVFFALMYSVFCLENVGGNESRDGADQKCISLIMRYVKESVDCVGKKRDVRVFSTVVLQVICICILMFCTTGDLDINFIYLRETIGYDRVIYGYYKGMDSFLRGMTMMIVPQLAKYFFNTGDFILVLIGIVSYMGNFVVLAFASAEWMPFVAATVGLLKGLPSAGLRSRMSSLVSQNEQGRLFGLVAASESIVTLISSLVFNELYPSTYSIFPGLCYLLATVCLAVTFILVMVTKARYPARVRDDSTDPYGVLEEEEDLPSEGQVSIQDGEI